MFTCWDTTITHAQNGLDIIFKINKCLVNKDNTDAQCLLYVIVLRGELFNY
jgi:hypothetical protein